MVPFAGRHSHFVTSSEPLQKSIQEFVSLSKSSHVAQQPMAEYKCITDVNVREFNITLIQCALQPLLPNLCVPVVRLNFSSCVGLSQYRLGKMDDDADDKPDTVSVEAVVKDYEDKVTALSQYSPSDDSGFSRRSLTL